MKKFIFTILGICTILSMFAGCVKTDDVQDTIITTIENVENTTNESFKVPFEEITVIDTEAVLVLITGITENPESPCGYNIDFHIENKTSDTNCDYWVQYLSVNNMELEPHFGGTIKSSEVRDDTMGDTNYLSHYTQYTNYYSANNKQAEITDIELTFVVYDENGNYYNQCVNPIARETVHIYPYGEGNATVYNRQPKNTDIVLIDNEFMRVTFVGTNMEHYFCDEYETYYFIENKSDRTLVLQADDVLLNGNTIYNGTMYTNWVQVEVRPNKCAYEQICWSENALIEYNIENIDELTLILRAYDEANIDPTDLHQEHINNLFKNTTSFTPDFSLN